MIGTAEVMKRTVSTANKRSLEVTLDQLWDLLRQRRALRDAGRSPDDAAIRPEGTVEGYRQ